MKKILTITFLAILGGIAAYAFLFYAERGSNSGFYDEFLKPRFILFIGGCFSIAFLLKWVNYRAYIKIVKNSLQSYGYIALFFANLILAVAASYLLFVLYGTIEGVSFFMLLDSNKELLLNFAVLLVIFLIIYNIISFFVFSYRKFANMQLEFIEQTKKQMTLQLEVLEQQLSPHFLFNNLNTISALIYSDIEKAENFIRNFASVYLTFSDTTTKTLITLKEELNFVEKYIYLLKTRFLNSIEFKIKIDDKYLESAIIPLAIQIMIENAIKHNTFNDSNPLTITISTSNTKLYVANNYLPKKEKGESYEIGQQNLLKRYKKFSNKKPLFQVINNQYIAELPLLKNSSE